MLIRALVIAVLVFVGLLVLVGRESAHLTPAVSITMALASIVVGVLVAYLWKKRSRGQS